MALVVLGGLLAQSLSARVRQSSPSLKPHSARELLYAYDRGSYDAVVADLASRRNLNSPHSPRGTGPVAKFLEELKRTAPAWIGAQGADQIPRRRLVAASLALEAAHALPPLLALHYLDVEIDARYGLLDWSSATLAQSAVPLAAERWWWLSAIASIQSQADVHYFLREGQALLQVGEGRFPDERRFTLQEGLLWNMGSYSSLITHPGALAGISNDVGLVAVEDAAGRVDIRLANSALGAVPTRRGDYHFSIRAAEQAFSAVLDDGALRPEAELRLGSVEVLINESAKAVPHLKEAAQTSPERDIRYLAFVFLAAAHARNHEAGLAEQALGDATALIPGTDSVARILAWLYASNGHQAEATRVMTAQLHAPTVPDPLLVYSNGDGARWEEFVSQLRKELRQ